MFFMQLIFVFQEYTVCLFIRSRSMLLDLRGLGQKLMLYFAITKWKELNCFFNKI